VTEFLARRLDTDGLSIISQWFDPSGQPLCYALEPGDRRVPHPAIPAGRYRLGLRTVGQKHAHYLSKFGPAFHKGMIEICNVPGRTAVEAHIGNTIDDTEGCSLLGETMVMPRYAHSGHWEVQRSEIGYRAVYPILRDAVRAGDTFLTMLAIAKGVPT
jgi:hypothetical protein